MVHPYSVSLYYNTLNSTPDLDQVISDTLLLGCGSTRINVYVDQITSEEGVYNWSFLHTIVNKYYDAGLELWIDFYNWPMYMKKMVVINDVGQHVLMLDGESCSIFLTAFLTEFSGKFHHLTIQCANEEYDSQSLTNPTAFLSVLQTIYPLVKSFDNTIDIMSPAHFEIGIIHVAQWQDKLYQPYTDGSSSGSVFSSTDMHYYVNFAPWDNSSKPWLCNFPEEWGRCHWSDISNGYGSKMIRIGEIGWRANDKTSESNQAAYLQWSLNNAVLSGCVEQYSWWTIVRGDAAYGLIAADGRHKPAFDIYQQFISDHPYKTV